MRETARKNGCGNFRDFSRFSRAAMKPRRLLLRNRQSPGDVVMLTAAVRDLHAQHPGRFITAVDTTAMALWDHNPHARRWDRVADAGSWEAVECGYPLIARSNTGPWHFIHGFHHFLAERLEVRLEPGAFRGDVHLSPEEKAMPSAVPVPFWIVVSGGKRDFTTKWWDPARMQAVVDHVAGRILFVQTGEAGHHHPPLRGVLDLRGKTDTREFVRLMYHAQGVVCPVTFAMHLAAAVETRGPGPNRPCVVVAGGREPAQWEAYPHHQYIHTNGALRCCDNGGCWKARTVPLGDGDAKDASLCVDVVGNLPRCMDMISAEDVIGRVEMYFRGGAVEFLTKEQAAASAQAFHFPRARRSGIAGR